MNTVALIGRLTRDPDVRTIERDEPMKVARYTLAVDRTRAKQDQKADFIGCIAFGKRADFAEAYLHKGTKIGITGRIQTGEYTDKEGRKVYTTDVVVDSHYFCEGKKEEGFVEAKDEELPFN